jgi:hypothetical protein
MKRLFEYYSLAHFYFILLKLHSLRMHRILKHSRLILALSLFFHVTVP